MGLADLSFFPVLYPHSCPSAAIMCNPCSRSSITAARFSRAAFSDPGRFSSRLLPLIPATARDSIARGVTFSPSTHMATGMAGISRSSTARDICARNTFPWDVQKNRQPGANIRHDAQALPALHLVQGDDAAALVNGEHHRRLGLPAQMLHIGPRHQRDVPGALHLPPDWA